MQKDSIISREIISTEKQTLWEAVKQQSSFHRSLIVKPLAGPHASEKGWRTTMKRHVTWLSTENQAPQQKNISKSSLMELMIPSICGNDSIKQSLRETREGHALKLKWGRRKCNLTPNSMKICLWNRHVRRRVPLPGAQIKKSKTRMQKTGASLCPLRHHS